MKTTTIENTVKCHTCQRAIEGEEIVTRHDAGDKIAQCPECYAEENQFMGNLRRYRVI